MILLVAVVHIVDGWRACCDFVHSIFKGNTENIRTNYVFMYWNDGRDTFKSNLCLSTDILFHVKVVVVAMVTGGLGVNCAEIDRKSPNWLEFRFQFGFRLEIIFAVVSATMKKFKRRNGVTCDMSLFSIKWTWAVERSRRKKKCQTHIALVPSTLSLTYTAYGDTVFLGNIVRFWDPRQQFTDA